MEHNKAKVDVCINLRAMYFRISSAKQNFNSSVFIENESKRGLVLHKNSKKMMAYEKPQKVKKHLFNLKNSHPNCKIFC